jgi:hypothetical protein
MRNGSKNADFKCRFFFFFFVADTSDSEMREKQYGKSLSVVSPFALSFLPRWFFDIWEMVEFALPY